MPDPAPPKKSKKQLAEEAATKAFMAAIPAGAPLMAARVGDLTACPQVNPDLSPHVGLMIMPPGVPTVLIGGQPAAVVGNPVKCVGDIPNVIAKGSATVFIGGKPAARMLDATAHGGMIVKGFPQVIIGG